MKRVALKAWDLGITEEDSIINMDETGLKLVPIAKYAYAKKGKKVVMVEGLDDKRQITTVCATTMRGTPLPPQLIYGGKTAMVHPSSPVTVDLEHQGWLFDHSESHWANQDTTIRWLRHVLTIFYWGMCEKHGRLPETQPCILLWDAYRAHMGPEVRAVLAREFSWLHILYVPANCTSACQPQDLGLIGPSRPASSGRGCPGL